MRGTMMFSRIPRHLSPATVVAFLALVFAMTGGAFAMNTNAGGPRPLPPPRPRARPSRRPSQAPGARPAPRVRTARPAR